MTKDQENALVVFEDKKIRRIWYNKEWYFSVVDVVAALAESPTPRQYWGKVKDREFKALELSPIWVQLKLLAGDGKKYATDCANTKSMFRIIQSIPSKKAEPFKQWLAKVGYERVQEIEDPELIFSMLGESVSTEITRKEDAQGYDEVEEAAKRGGKVAGNARKETEKELGGPITSKENYLSQQEKKSLKHKNKEE
jgi:prophage antirepressor-like protein